MNNTKVQKLCTHTYITNILVFAFIIYIYAQRVFVPYIYGEFVTYICMTAICKLHDHNIKDQSDLL